MRRHAIIWSWIFFALIMIMGVFFLFVGIIDLLNLDEVMKQMTPGILRDDVIAACWVLIVIGAINILAVAIITPLSVKAIKTANRKGQLIALGVLSIIFNGIVPGILMLCISNEELSTPY